MDLASVVAALASVGVRVSGSAPNSNVQVDSSRACPPGLAGPEPSGTINDLGQHLVCTMAYQDIAHSNLMRYEASGNTDLCRNVLKDVNHQCK